jgi:hypothetical protein
MLLAASNGEDKYYNERDATTHQRSPRLSVNDLSVLTGCSAYHRAGREITAFLQKWLSKLSSHEG